MSKRIRRWLVVSDEMEERCKGNRVQIWGYGVADFAKLLGETEENIRKRIRKGQLHPDNLSMMVNDLLKIVANKGQIQLGARPLEDA